MATNLDLLPLYDAITQKSKDHLSYVWRDAMATYHQTLISYLTQFGIFLPQLTTAQRDSIQSPVNGQMIYNTTLNTAQYFKAGIWASF